MGSEREYDDKGLNEKQRIFCEEYLIDLNATRSALRAGYSEKTAYSTGHELLKKPEIQNYISERKAVRSERTAITADMVLKEFAKIAFSDIRSFYKPDGSLKLPSEMGDEAHCLGGIETDEIWAYNPETEKKERVGEAKKIKLYDKVRALESLGKHLGIFEKDNSQKKVDVISPETLASLADKINNNATS
jgi:phage terminase small subunit